MRIYISGKISGLPEEQAEKRFRLAEEKLKENFIHSTIINPYVEAPKLLKNKPNATWLEYMSACIALLSRCDTIYHLYGWQMSDGAVIEHRVAEHENFIMMYDYK